MRETGHGHITVGKWNNFTGYRILLHELPVVVVLITQSNNDEGTMKNSNQEYSYLKSVQKMLHTVFQVMELHNLHVVKYGINLVK